MSNLAVSAGLGCTCDPTKRVGVRVLDSSTPRQTISVTAFPSPPPPPTTPRPPPVCNPIELGHLAIRDDGAILLSTEDCEDRDLSDRRLHTFILLTHEEAAFAHEKALDGIAFAAARVANKLPRKATP